MQASYVSLIIESEAIISTTPTSHNTTPVALEYEGWQNIAALLAPVVPSNIRPVVMLTLVILDQIPSRSLQQLGSLPDSKALGDGVLVDDTIGSVHELVLVPLRAGTGLPCSATDVTEMGTAKAGYD